MFDYDAVHTLTQLDQSRLYNLIASASFATNEHVS